MGARVDDNRVNMRPIQKSIFKVDSTETLAREAIDFLRVECPEGAIVRISGGKDSIVALELVRRAGMPYTLQYSNTGIDPPEIVRFIRANYPDCEFVFPKKSFWKLILTHNPPGGSWAGIKWCCTKLKKIPGESPSHVKSVLGIRAEESHQRAKYGRINRVKGLVHLHPIFHWKSWHVWDFIGQNNLPYPRLYDDGLDRIGCVICPDHARRHDFFRRRWPRYFDRFEKCVTEWWWKRRDQGRRMWHCSPEEYLIDWYDGRFNYYWQKKIFKNDLFE